jgi:hypothetical protein
MGYEAAKQLLERAATVEERAEAIEAALNMGMPLEEIEALLDWLDAMGHTCEEEGEEPR